MKRLLAALATLLTLACASFEGVQPTKHPVFYPGVVKLTSDVGQGHCSAFSIGPGRFLTAAHCLVDNLRINNEWAIPVAVNGKEDLAVLDGPKLPPLFLGGRPKFGDYTYVLGYADVGPVLVSGHYVGDTEFPKLYTSPKAAFSDQFTYMGLSGAPVLDREGRVVSLHLCGSAGNHVSCGATYDALQDAYLRYASQNTSPASGR